MGAGKPTVVYEITPLGCHCQVSKVFGMFGRLRSRTAFARPLAKVRSCGCMVWLHEPAALHFLAPIVGKGTPAADGCMPCTHPRPEPGRKRRLNSLQEVGWWGDLERGILAGSQIFALVNFEHAAVILSNRDGRCH